MRWAAVPLLTAAMIWAVGGSAAARAELEFDGFVQGNYSGRLSDTPCPSGTSCDFLLAEERVQLKLDGFSEDGVAAFAARVDFFHDGVLNHFEAEIRELYLDLIGDHVGVRIGRQIVTWGTGDLLFINDIFPKDWVALFTGRPLQYLKIGSDAVKIDLFPAIFSAEIVVVPFFESDRLPMGDRLIIADPLPPEIPRNKTSPWPSVKNTELSFKVSRYFADWEVAAYFSKTFYRSPATILDEAPEPSEIQLFFPRLNTYGGSLTGGVLNGVLSMELGYYDSVEDRDGTNPGIENSQLKGLLGYNQPLWQDATLGVQGFAEWMQDYDAYRSSLPPGDFRPRDRLRWIATTRFIQRLLHQTLTLNFFAFWGITERDAYLIPSVRYAFTDRLWGEIGANLFAGQESQTMFGGLDQNDNIYLTVRYSF